MSLKVYWQYSGDLGWNKILLSSNAFIDIKKGSNSTVLCAVRIEIVSDIYVIAYFTILNDYTRLTLDVLSFPNICITVNTYTYTICRFS